MGADPYDVLYEDSMTFYEGLRNFFGHGADALLKILAKKIVNTYALEGVSPEEILELMERGDKESRERFINLVIKAVTGSGGE